MPMLIRFVQQQIHRGARYRCLTALIICLIGVALSPAAWAASMTASPAQGASGTSVRIGAEGLGASTAYILDFAGNGTTTLDTLTSDARGHLSANVVLPALAPGSGKLRLRTTGLGSTGVAATAFKVLGTLSFSLGRSNVHAGQSLPFTVQGLQAGTLSLIYDGELVYGPATVGSGAHTGKFVVPKNHPSLPQSVDVRLENRVGSTLINTLTYSLPVLPALASPFSLSIATPPPNQAKPGQRFNVTGSIAIGDNEHPVDDVSLWFFGDNGDVYPLGNATPSSTGNGASYVISAASAGLASMTAAQPSSGHTGLRARGDSDFGLGVHSKLNPDNPGLQPLQDDRWRLTIQVKSNDGTPIPGALVYFDTPSLVESDPDDDGLVLTSTSSVLQSIGTAMPTQYTIAIDRYGCPLTLERVRADAHGYASFEFTDDALRASLVNPDIDHHSNVYADLAIDASAQGYGFVTTNGIFLKHRFHVAFSGLDDPGNESISLIDYYQNVEVAHLGRNGEYVQYLGAIAPRLSIIDTNILPWLQQPYTQSVPGPAGTTASVQGVSFGPVFNLPAAINSAWVHDGGMPGDPGYPTQVTVRIDRAVSGTNLQGKLFLDLNRNGTAEQVGTFSRSAGAIDCSGIDGITTLDNWTANLPSLKNQAPGAIKGYVQFDGNGKTAREYVEIKIKALPVWYADAGYSGQSVNFGSGWQLATIQAVEDTPDAAVQLGHDPGYDIGRLHNSTDNSRAVKLDLFPSGYTSVSAPLLGEHDEAGHHGADTALYPAEGEHFAEHYTMLDQSFPLFFYTWGIPVLAGIKTGANFDILAELDIAGKYILQQPSNKPALTVTTTPSLDLGLDFYIDLDVLFDLADVNVHLLPTFDLKMPVEVVNGVAQDPQTCFTASLIFQYTVEIFCLPGDFICDTFNDFSGSETLVSDQSGSGCHTQSAPAKFAAAAALVRAHSAVAFDGHGNGWMAFTLDDSHGAQPRKLVMRAANGGVYDRADDDVVLSNAPGIRSIEIAYYDENRAVAVWAENADDYATLVTRTPEQRIARQHLMYSKWDGQSWSSKATLTPVSGGEGGVTLAGCMAATGACPAAGEVLAAWTRDSNGRITDHRTQVFHSRFVPTRGWTTPQSVDSQALLDSAPSAAYAAGVPVVAFVRSNSGVFAQTDDRHLAYRFLSGTSAVQVPAGLPGAVGWPSLQALANGDLVLTYTHADDPRAFAGNTQRLALARGKGCSSAVCSFSGRDLDDAHGRAIYAEQPRLVLDDAGSPTVVFRGVGYGTNLAGSNHEISDPIGMALHTGELMQASFDWAQGGAQPVAISSDGGGHLAPRAAFDADMNQLVVVSDTTAPIDAQRQLRYAAAGTVPPRAAGAAVTVADGLTVHGVLRGVDFAIEDVTTTATSATAGQAITVDVRIRNRGAPYAATGAAWLVRLDWDAPGQAGDTITARGVPALASGESKVVSITFTPAAGFAADQAHRLYATLDRATSPVMDIDGSNNERYITLGGMPQPQHLRAAPTPAGGFVVLSWDKIADARVKGYRIWAQDDGRAWKHLGSSFSAAFIDLAAPAGKQRRYRVTSYSGDAIESERSDTAVATPTPTPDPVPGDVVFRNGFE